MTSLPRTIRAQGQRSTAAPDPQARSGFAARISLGKLVKAESANYVMLLALTIFMVAFGLVMVLSSSSVDSYLGTDNMFAKFIGQGTYALIGVPLMLLASRLPSSFWKRWSLLFLLAACALQVLVLATPLGVGTGHNKNWLQIGSLTAQPSEAIKIALVVWLGVLLTRKGARTGQWRHAIVPVLISAGIPIALVMAGGDLGTVLIMTALVLGALFFAGVPIRFLALTTILGGAVAVLIAISSTSRLDRIEAFLGVGGSPSADQHWQITHGFYALASGGVFGVGLGNSTAKWAWLPVADSDFIFAIIGEELGLIGAVLVLCLFVLLAFIFLRIIHASTDPFERIATSAVMVWMIGQALVNIGVVLGLIPVLGVPLPLISRGGTALISSLIAIGIVLSFARNAPARNRQESALSAQQRRQEQRKQAAREAQARKAARQPA